MASKARFSCVKTLSVAQIPTHHVESNPTFPGRHQVSNVTNFGQIAKFETPSACNTVFYGGTPASPPKSDPTTEALRCYEAKPYHGRFSNPKFGFIEPKVEGRFDIEPVLRVASRPAS